MVVWKRRITWFLTSRCAIVLADINATRDWVIWSWQQHLNPDLYTYFLSTYICYLYTILYSLPGVGPNHLQLVVFMIVLNYGTHIRRYIWLAWPGRLAGWLVFFHSLQCTLVQPYTHTNISRIIAFKLLVFVKVLITLKLLWTHMFVSINCCLPNNCSIAK